MRLYLPSVMLFSLILSAFSCGVTAESPKEIELTFNVLKNGALFGGGEEGLKSGIRVLHNADDWKSMLDSMNKINTHVAPDLFQTIDFEQDMVLVYIDRVRSSGGYGVCFNKVMRTADKLIPIIDFQSPIGPAASVLTQPYEIIRLRNYNVPMEVRLNE